MCLYVRVGVGVRVGVYVYMCVHTCVCACVCACIRVCVYIYMCVTFEGIQATTQAKPVVVHGAGVSRLCAWCMVQEYPAYVQMITIEEDNHYILTGNERIIQKAGT